MIWSGSHDFWRMVTEPLKVCARTEPETSFSTSGEENPCTLCGPSTPVTLTGELKTSRSSCVRRGTLMSKSVSTTLLPLAKSHHERSRWLASTTTTFEPEVWMSSLMRSSCAAAARRTASITTSDRSDAVMVTRPEKFLSRSVPPGSIGSVRLMCSVSSKSADWPEPASRAQGQRKRLQEFACSV